MFSSLMLIVIFLEALIAVVSILGSILVAHKYSTKTNNRQDFYVSLILAVGAFADINVLISQIAFNLQVTAFPEFGFKLVLASITIIEMLVWLHLADIYCIKAKAVTIFLSVLSAIVFYFIGLSSVNMALMQGVIAPIGLGPQFIIVMLLLMLIVAIEVIANIHGLGKNPGMDKARFKLSRTASGYYLAFIIFFFLYNFTGIVYFYVLFWLGALCAFTYLFLFTMIPSNSPVIAHPLNYLRSKILFKLVIVLVITVTLSLECMALITISLAKSALSESLIENYRRNAEVAVHSMDLGNSFFRSDNEILSVLTKLVKDTGLSTHGCVFVISPTQRVYTFCGVDGPWTRIIPGAFAYDVQNFNLAGGEFLFDNKTFIGNSVRIPGIGWRLIIGQPMNAAYAKVMQMEGLFILAFLVLLAITVIVGVLLTNNLVNPLRTVRHGILRIADGDLDYNIDVHKTDEIAELAHSVNKMTKQLKASQDSLLRSERLAALGFMAAGLVHEIKNALVPLRTLTEILTVSGGDQSFVTKFNELVPKEIDRITKLSNDLLHYSRPIEGSFEYLNINDVIEESIKFLEMEARKSNVAIKRSLGQVSDIKGDRQAIIEAFTNIILNALEVMHSGQVTISSYEQNGNVVVSIADNGPGIPEENLAKVFVPFFTTKKEGTGMGLAITQKIMADHGGKIEIKSKHGEGTTFFLIFPRKT